MFFALSKTMDLLIDPWWWAFILLVAGLALVVRGKRRALGLGLAHAGLAVLFLFSLPAVANRLWHSLEADAVDSFKPAETYDAVVLLGGTVSSHGSTPQTPAFNDNVDRLTVTYRLLTTGQAKVAIVSGGSLGTDELPTEAAFVAGQLEAWGVATERVVVEPRAQNTRENATYTKALLEAVGGRRCCW